jgi:hypothetical protein
LLKNIIKISEWRLLDRIDMGCKTVRVLERMVNCMYMDEKIIEVMNEAKEEKEEREVEEAREALIGESVRNGLLELDDEVVEFADRFILDDKVVMKIPKDFEPLSSDLVAFKYPSEHRPQIILSDETSTINLTFNHTVNPLSEDDLTAFKDFMIETLQKLQPSSQISGDGVRVINGRPIGFFELLSRAADGFLYNWVFFTELEGRALLCNFNCLEEQMDFWKPIFKGMMETYKLN